MSSQLPPLGFHFSVHFELPGGREDYRFQSLSGLSIEYETESVMEGGENRFIHDLPGRTKYTNLVLKRGLVPDSGLIKWCRNAFDYRLFWPITLNIQLLNPQGEPLQTWNVDRAWPLKWSVGDFNAEESAVVIETLELAYRTFR